METNIDVNSTHVEGVSYLITVYNKERYVAEVIKSVISQNGDFQKEIIKQKLQSYYHEKKTIYFSNIKYYEKEEQLKTLDATYFSDLKELVSEEVIKSIQDFVKNNKEELKKKKKRNKKNN